jgi:hypothetical protein
MNLTFLGDALDHWKGSLFESLSREGILRNFAVDPMASDLPAWRPEDFLLFAQLLRIDRSQIVEHQADLNNRSRYFAEITFRRFVLGSGHGRRNWKARRIPATPHSARDRKTRGTI